MSKEKNEIEGEFVRKALKKKRDENNDWTQDYYAEKLDRKQTAFPGWLSGKTRIPDKVWIQFGLLLEFDPFKLRPELTEFRDMLNEVSGFDPSAIEKVVSLTPEQQEAVAAAIRAAKNEDT